MSQSLTVTVDGRQTVLRWQSNSADGRALAPAWHPQLRGKWLAVVGIDRNLSLAASSSGCGDKAKHWCIAAPGVSIHSGDKGVHGGVPNPDGSAIDNDNTMSINNPTPHISGALALLKSRLPQVPMSVLVHILLSTATDLGAPGVDEVYGHGLVNIARAITMQGSINLAEISPAQQGTQQGRAQQGLLMHNANAELPSSFAGFAKRLNGIGIAAEYFDGFYFDMPLGGMIKAQGKKQPPLNFAANLFNDDAVIQDDGVFAFSHNGALKAAGWWGGGFQFRHNFYNQPSLWQNKGGDINHRPFFADDGGYSNEMLVDIGDNFQLFAARGEEHKAEYSQMGIQWRRQLSSLPKLKIAAAHSNITEDETLLGGKFGGLMPLTDGGNIRQTDIGASYALDSRWRIYGGYQRADIGAKFGGIVGDMRGVVAEGWNSGFAAKDWIKKGDNFRIGIGQKTRITRGDMLLRINQSTNPQKDESTQAMHNRGYQTTQQRISLAEDSPLFFAIGYAFAPGDNAQLAIGINARRHSPSALSIDWRWDF